MTDTLLALAMTTEAVSAQQRTLYDLEAEKPIVVGDYRQIEVADEPVDAEAGEVRQRNPRKKRGGVSKHE